MAKKLEAHLQTVVEAHGVAFELSATPIEGPDAITEAGFQKYVDKLRRMVIGISQAEAEMLRDELLIIDALGDGVRLDALAEHHPLSMSASVATRTAKDASQVRVRAFDPILNPRKLNP